MCDLKAMCWAKQHSDQMKCDLCNLVWDVNDPSPPSCIASIELKQAARKGWIRVDLPQTKDN